MKYYVSNINTVVRFLLFICFSFVIMTPQYGQNEADTLIRQPNIIKKRAKNVFLIEGAFITSSYTSFYYLWYKNFDKSNFHFFNDGAEWMGIDKLGHSCASYWISNLNSQVFRWSGVDRKKASIYGTVSSFLYMSTIEIFDGFSAEWGASGWDLAANASGATLYLVQNLTFQKQIVMLKYSYYPSSYSQYRPSVLGLNLGEKVLKDYNATKFWLSINLNNAISSKIPPWLNLAFGYGASGMTGGFKNYISTDANSKTIPDSERNREFYISTDIDLSKIKLKSKFLRGLFYSLNFIKIPGPAIGHSNKKWIVGIR